MNFPIIQTLTLDPFPIASMIETVVGEYLLPPAPGIYVKGRFEPAMVPQGMYYQQVDGRGDTVDAIAGVRLGKEVRDLDGNVLITPG